MRPLLAALLERFYGGCEHRRLLWCPVRVVMVEPSLGWLGTCSHSSCSRGVDVGGPQSLRAELRPALVRGLASLLVTGACSGVRALVVDTLATMATLQADPDEEDPWCVCVCVCVW